MHGIRRVAGFGGVAALLAWMAVLANCGGGSTAPSPIVSLAVTCPSAVQSTSTDGNPVAVTYAAPTATGGTAPTSVSCAPASGSAFPVGATNISCTARDNAGKTASCGFTVTVSRNTPPSITALTLSATRVDVRGTVQATATVQDAETSPSAMKYEWTADRGGAFTGQGASVTWVAPEEKTTPVDARLTVTVIESYPLAGGSGATGETKVSKTSDPIHIHDSVAEISTLVMTFLGDFSNSAVPPATCVRNFSDTCRGKEEERLQIADNRRDYVILSSTYRVGGVYVERPFSWATIIAPCSFTSRKLATGAVETATGNCLLTATFQQENWLLCDSNFQPTTALPPGMKDFFGIRR